MSEEKKYKILQVHNFYQIPGGEDTVVENEKKMLEENGHVVIQYVRNNSELKKFSIIRKLCLPFTTIFNPRTYQDVKKIIRTQNIDVVHVHNTLNLISPAVYYAAQTCKVPVVQTIHNFRMLCPGATFYRDGRICEDCVSKGLKCAVRHGCYRNNKAQTLICVINTWIHRMTGIYGKVNYICLTEFNKQKLLSLKQIKEDKVFVKPNFVCSYTDNNIQPDKRKNQFIFAGRLDSLKGIDILLKTWKKMGDMSPKLVVCGIGPMEEWCHQFIEDNKIESVELKGFVSNDEVRRLITNSKALILPTRWYEGFPISIVEAFSVGTPVVCSDLGNVGNLIVDGITGYKFEANSVEKLNQSIHQLLSNPIIHETTYKEYTEKYTQDLNNKRLIEIYQEILL